MSDLRTQFMCLLMAWLTICLSPTYDYTNMPKTEQDIMMVMDDEVDDESKDPYTLMLPSANDILYTKPSIESDSGEIDNIVETQEDADKTDAAPVTDAETIPETEADTTTPPEEPKNDIDISYIHHKYKKELPYLAKTIWGEARGCSITEQAAVVWCILNRVDSDLPYMPDDIIGVITKKYQFTGYAKKHPVKEEFVDLAADVLLRWELEKEGDKDVGRVLPSEYLWFHGSDGVNHFRDSYKGGTRWDWSLESPY